MWVNGVVDLNVWDDGVDDLDVEESEGVDSLAEDERKEHEFDILLLRSSSPEPSDNDSEPDITPEWCVTLREIEGFSFNLCGIK